MTLAAGPNSLECKIYGASCLRIAWSDGVQRSFVRNLPGPERSRTFMGEIHLPCANDPLHPGGCKLRKSQRIRNGRLKTLRGDPPRYRDRGDGFGRQSGPGREVMAVCFACPRTVEPASGPSDLERIDPRCGDRVRNARAGRWRSRSIGSGVTSVICVIPAALIVRRAPMASRFPLVPGGGT